MLSADFYKSTSNNILFEICELSTNNSQYMHMLGPGKRSLHEAMQRESCLLYVACNLMHAAASSRCDVRLIILTLLCREGVWQGRLALCYARQLCH